MVNDGDGMFVKFLIFREFGGGNMMVGLMSVGCFQRLVCQALGSLLGTPSMSNFSRPNFSLSNN